MIKYKKKLKMNERFYLKVPVSNIFHCSCCFRPIAIWLSFRCWPTLISPFTDCCHWAKLPILFQKFCNNCSVSKTKFPQCLDPSCISYNILPITKVISLTAIMTWNIEEFRAYYNAMLHVNIKIMTSQQRWYLLLNYLNNEINFLFSCEIRSWSLRFRQFDICQVNAAQSNTLVYSFVPSKWAKFGGKIFRHFWDTTIFVLWYLFCLTLYRYLYKDFWAHGWLLP